MDTASTNQKALMDVLQAVASGAVSPAAALEQISAAEMNLGFARVDLDRPRRCGLPEVIFCAGKTAGQVISILSAMKQAGQNILGTRVLPGLYAEVARAHPDAKYHEAARCLTLEVAARPEGTGSVAVVCAGTSDIPVAEEAALTAEWMGAKVTRIFDVGVAGLHRLLRHVDTLRRARAIVVAAGMEGALPSVVGGLVDRPLIAVPTSIGYGAHFNGLTPLLAMLNSCAAGVTVVNIDNGFGAGVAAALINRAGASA